MKKPLVTSGRRFKSVEKLYSGSCPRTSSGRTRAGSGHLSVLLARLPCPVTDRTVPDAGGSKAETGKKVKRFLCHKWGERGARRVEPQGNCKDLAELLRGALSSVTE